ncbi:energy-coupled thiamine transporter ThiT [Alkaliphilus hydrothermalis]|uniref:Thiamine transporter n=1 Tax=Alkaliphilus hydrothermalis TaxID=1482730 RepID=A0ABS2NTL4_9FIRM|nr:energy-coupled thiamine transporter ThiT [Alkaliphilus hydrothermalis]MBM7616112.1 thiamine transporter [Alkaliphilus hydrothermalis]
MKEMFEKLFEFTPATLSILAVLAIIGIGGLVFLKKSKEVQFTTRMIVYGSLCISLSFVLSFIRLGRLPQGGTITPASMLPMILFAVMFGPIPGIIAGLAYGMLQYFQDGYVVHWAQFFLDYPLAFGLLGLAGLYRKNLVVSTFIGGLGRFTMHFLSGIIFFAEYAPEGTPVALYSLIYNGSFLGVDLLICAAIAILPQIRNITRYVQGNATL